MAHGLNRGSFAPDAHTQELRGLLQKTLEDANIKLDSVISDILGRSGRTMIEADRRRDRS